MGLLIGGKTIDQAPKRTIASKPIDLGANNALDLERYGDVNRDPFTAHADWSPGMRASFLIDTAIALEQGLEETAATARKVASMRRKLADPANEGAPGRSEAIRKVERLEYDVLNGLWLTIRDEARADREWQAMTPDDRALHGVDYWWRTDANEPRLIGRAFYGIAAQFKWPRRFRLPRDVLRGQEWPLVVDFNAANVFDWSPSPVEDIWPDQEHMPTRIAREIAERTGNNANE